MKEWLLERAWDLSGYNLSIGYGINKFSSLFIALYNYHNLKCLLMATIYRLLI